MKSRFTYVGDTVVEVVIEGDSLTWNVLPLAPKRPSAPEPSTAPSIPAAPPESGADSADAPGAAPDSPRANGPENALEAISAPPMPGALSGPIQAPLTPKRRTLMGTIRAAWFVVFSVLGEALTYFLNNMTTLSLPPGTATAIGAVGYGLKRGLWPDSTI